MKIVKNKYYIIALLLLGLFLFSCDDTDNGSSNSNTIIGSWTKTGGTTITFYDSGAITTNNFGTGTYGNGEIYLSVPIGNSGTGSYNLSGSKLIISGFVQVGATKFNQLNGEWLRME